MRKVWWVLVGFLALNVLLLGVSVKPNMEKMERSDVEIRLQKALEAIQKGENPMNAVRELKKLTEDYPENADVRYYLGLFSLQSHQIEKAVDRFIEVIELQPDYLDVHVLLAKSYLDLDEKEKALEHLSLCDEKNTSANLLAEARILIKKLNEN